METKTCTSCHTSKPLEDYSLRHNKRIPWCKLCVAEKTRTWYQHNKQRALKNTNEWARKNRRRSNEIKKKWEDKNKEYRIQWLKNYRKRRRIQLLDEERNQLTKKRNDIEQWLLEVGESVINSKIKMFCYICGMKTEKEELYYFQKKLTCIDCLIEYRDASATIKPQVKNTICIDCGGMSYDTRYTKCGPCRVADNVKRMIEIRSLLSF